MDFARWSRAADWQSSRASRARALNTAFNAFVEISRRRPVRWRRLAGLPFAAKDMLQSPAHRPKAGLPKRAISGSIGNSDLLDRLEEAGADRSGSRPMTEFAYEPSGFNAARGRVKSPWNPGPRPRRFIVRIGCGGCERCGGRCTRVGHRRFAPHPGDCCGITAWKPTYGASRRAARCRSRHHSIPSAFWREARLICCRLFRS